MVSLRYSKTCLQNSQPSRFSGPVIIFLNNRYSRDVQQQTPRFFHNCKLLLVPGRGCKNETISVGSLSNFPERIANLSEEMTIQHLRGKNQSQFFRCVRKFVFLSAERGQVARISVRPGQTEPGSGVSPLFWDLLFGALSIQHTRRWAG